MRRKVTAFLLLTSSVLLTAPLSAGSSSTQLNVSVQVIARTILTVDSQPATIDITSDDVARGYIDLPQAVGFHIRSNAANGYSLQFEPLGSPFTRADVNWGSTLATVGSDGTWLTRPYQQGTTSGTLSVRLTVAPGTSAGSYPWPVRFAAESL
jgi:hypothetical protein